MSIKTVLSEIQVIAKYTVSSEGRTALVEWWRDDLRPSLVANVPNFVGRPLGRVVWYHWRRKRYKSHREAWMAGLSDASYETLGYIRGRGALRREMERKQLQQQIQAMLERLDARATALERKDRRGLN